MAAKMNWLQVTSSDIASIGYNNQTKQLGIMFHRTGCYIYENVPREVFNEMKNANSIGRFFHQKIKDSYVYFKGP